MLDYEEKPFEYYNHIRREIIDEVPIGSDSVLEVGCAEGHTGAVLKEEGRARRVVGIELMDVAADQARIVLDQVLSGNIEQMDLPFLEGQFDVIILADVLEHLVDPWSTLRRLKFYLKTNGLVIVSLPNVRNWRISMSLFFLGNWEYQDEGIMDRTHLRFFTRKGMLNMLRECGFESKKIEPIGQRSKKFLWLRMYALSELTAVQYVLIGCLNRK